MNISGEGVADSRPEVRVTQVVFYDQIGHVVPFDFDPDILSRGLEIFLSGFFKMLTDDDPLCENGIPVTQVGKFSLVVFLLLSKVHLLKDSNTLRKCMK